MSCAENLEKKKADLDWEAEWLVSSPSWGAALVLVYPRGEDRDAQ